MRDAFGVVRTLISKEYPDYKEIYNQRSAQARGKAKEAGRSVRSPNTKAGQKAIRTGQAFKRSALRLRKMEPYIDDAGRVMRHLP